MFKKLQTTSKNAFKYATLRFYKYVIIINLIMFFIISFSCPAAAIEKHFQLAPGFSYHEIPHETREFMTGKSYHSNKYVKFDDLRLCKVNYIGFDGKTHTGELVVAHEVVMPNGETLDLAKEVLEIFKEMYDAKYPIEKIKLIDHYGADDEESMRDNNSCAFNFRYIRGTDKISWHSYGLAIDINPLQNPCFDRASQFIEPYGSDNFLNRDSKEVGIIKEGDPCHKAFTKRGWEWGGYWGELYGKDDYMHFQKLSRYATRPPAKY